MHCSVLKCRYMHIFCEGRVHRANSRAYLLLTGLSMIEVIGDTQPIMEVLTKALHVFHKSI
jgi:hypothetical protein